MKAQKLEGFFVGILFGVIAMFIFLTINKPISEGCYLSEELPTCISELVKCKNIGNECVNKALIVIDQRDECLNKLSQQEKAGER